MQRPPQGSLDCQHCNTRPADLYLFTTIIRTGGSDATKRTTYVCAPCAADAEKWLEHIGLRVTRDTTNTEWDALIAALPNQTPPAKT